MIPMTQLIRHNPEEGRYGDCFRTCIASIFEISPTEVPHFAWDDCDGAVMTERANEYLGLQNLEILHISFQSNIEETLGMMAHTDFWYILSGTGNLGGCHSVIAKGDMIVHDPAINADQWEKPLIGPDQDGHVWVSVLVFKG